MKYYDICYICDEFLLTTNKKGEVLSFINIISRLKQLLKKLVFHGKLRVRMRHFVNFKKKKTSEVNPLLYAAGRRGFGKGSAIAA